MTYYADLTAYTYIEHDMREGTVNVGWLDPSRPFVRGNSSQEFLGRLWQYCCYPVARTRGYCPCDFCKGRQLGPLRVSRGKQDLRLGTAEIRVFGEHGRIYAAPDLVYHYVSEHSYLPPEEFVNAVLECPLPQSEEYGNLLAGVNLPAPICRACPDA